MKLKMLNSQDMLIYSQETLHTRCRNAHGRPNPNGAEYSQNDDGIDDQEMKSEESLLRNRPLMAIIIVYCVFSLQEIAYSEVRERATVHLSKIMGVSLSKAF